MTYLDFLSLEPDWFRLGLEPAWFCEWANDIDPRKQEIYLANFGDDEFVLDDVGKVTASSLPAGTDMAWASFPCQDLFACRVETRNYCRGGAEPSGNSGG